ncbi:MAG: hypothetical protein AAGA99_20050 [Actinomycetota bacterium]
MEQRFDQISPIAIVLTIAIVVVPIGIAAAIGDATGSTLAVTSIIGLAMGVLIWTFNRLSVRVNDDAVVVAFGFGLPRRTITFDRILAARPVRNRWYAGWGIRYLRTGWMWNVWGLSAVELDLAGGRHFRIGTDRPDELAAAITRRTARNRR